MYKDGFFNLLDCINNKFLTTAINNLIDKGILKSKIINGIIHYKLTDYGINAARVIKQKVKN